MKHLILISFVFLLGCLGVTKKKEIKFSQTVLEKTNKTDIATILDKKKNSIFSSSCTKESVINQSLINNIYEKINLNTDSLDVLSPTEDKIMYVNTIDRINKQTKLYKPSYYYFILENKDNNIKRTFFSQNYLYEKNKSTYSNIDLLIVFSKILDETDTGEYNKVGYNFDLISYDNQEQKLIDRVRLITSGIGLEDITYHECFNIESNKITTYSYNSIEDESIFIKRVIIINSNGFFTEKQPSVKIYD